MEDYMLSLKMTARQLKRSAKKCEKDEAAEKRKVKEAIRKGNMDGARIHSECAIRQKNQGLNCLRMAARVDGVASRVESAARMKTVTQGMAGIVRSLDRAMATMNLDQISVILGNFERQFENLDVQSEFVDAAMSASVAATTPGEQVDALIQRVADENHLDLVGELGAAVASAPLRQEADLEAHLAKLKTPS